MPHVHKPTPAQREWLAHAGPSGYLPPTIPRGSRYSRVDERVKRACVAAGWAEWGRREVLGHYITDAGRAALAQAST